MSNPFEEINTRLQNIESIMLQLAKFNPETRLEEDLPMNIDEAAAFIKLKRPTVYALVSANNIPYMKRGKRLYFSRKDLTNWLHQGRVKTKAEIEGVSFLKK